MRTQLTSSFHKLFGANQSRIKECNNWKNQNHHTTLSYSFLMTVACTVVGTIKYAIVFCYHIRGFKALRMWKKYLVGLEQVTCTDDQVSLSASTVFHEASFCGNFVNANKKKYKLQELQVPKAHDYEACCRALD